MMSEIVSPYFDHYQTLKPTFIGNHLPWMRAVRETNLTRALSDEFPSRHQENWKYTDLTFLATQRFNWNPRVDSISATQISHYCLENTPSHRLVFIDGCFCVPLSNLEALPDNITLMSLSEALLLHPERVKPYLEKEAACQLTKINTAFVNDGVVLHISKNTRVEQPIHLLFLSSEASHDTMVNLRNILLLEENSQANILEEHAMLCDTNQVKNIITQIICQTGATLHYHKLQRESQHTVHIARTEIQQARDSQLHSHSISLGAKLARDDLHVTLNEPGASCELNGFYALSDHQHIDHHTRIDHVSPHCNSDECYKGILQDKAVGVFNGKVIVHPHAQKTSSQQINKNLLLSKTAQMNTKPELEIYADDVKCAHGATVGQIEPEALFYLRSRGLSEADALSLLTHAFYSDVLERIKHPSMVEYIHTAISHKITTHSDV